MCARGTARYFLHSFPSFGLPVVQSYLSPDCVCVCNKLLILGGGAKEGSCVIFPCPILLFLGVFVSLVLFFLAISLVFLSVSAHLPGFKGSQREKIIGVFKDFLGTFKKTKENKDRVFGDFPCWGNEAIRFSGDSWILPVGRTPKGSYSPRGGSRYLLETPFSEPLLRTLLRTLVYCKIHSRPPSQNPSENPSPEPFP